jgi:hypothetical protein
LERIVLYIDDLDRCPPKRVVEALSAVYLLLALPLFVVVVAVDPRWLERSLRHHYAELLDPDPIDGPVTGELVATSLDYLDKIFQIPYALVPMGEHAGGYLRALLSDQPGSIPTPTRATAPDSTGEPERPGTVLPAETVTSPGMDPAGEESTDRREDLKDKLGLDGIAGRATTQAHTSRSVRNLQPEGLRLQPVERQFIPLLGPLLPLPGQPKSSSTCTGSSESVLPSRT